MVHFGTKSRFFFSEHTSLHACSYILDNEAVCIGLFQFMYRTCNKRIVSILTLTLTALPLLSKLPTAGAPEDVVAIISNKN